VHLVADRDDELLLAVLQEAIYVTDVYGEVPVAADLAVDDEGAVVGWFDVVDLAEVDVTGSVPKGVARHQLALTESGGTWRCRAVIDV
jgi:SHS2 domain-containing protein